MSGEIVVRSYDSADQPGVLALWALVFAEDPVWNDSLEMIRRKQTVQQELFFVCCAGDQVVGTVMAGFDGVRGWVHKVAAHPDYRRLGIASRLMQAAESGLADMGCPKLNLQVRAGNSSAVEFYTSAGYQIEDRVSMSKHLA